MALKDEIRVIQPSSRRVKLFADFWNITVAARSRTSLPIHVNWSELAAEVVRQTSSSYHDHSQGALAGVYIFGSVDRSSKHDRQLVDFANERFKDADGLYFFFNDRITKSQSATCKQCGNTVKMRPESGVDVQIAVEMVKHLQMGEHEYIALASGDIDFLPLVNFIRDQGHRLVHVCTKGPSYDIRQRSWKQIILGSDIDRLTIIDPSNGHMLLTVNEDEYTRDIRDLLARSEISYREINLLDENVQDKDVEYLVGRQPSMFVRHRDDRRWSGENTRIPQNARSIREALQSERYQLALPRLYVGNEEQLYRTDSGWIMHSTADRTTAQMANDLKEIDRLRS